MYIFTKSLKLNIFLFNLQCNTNFNFPALRLIYCIVMHCILSSKNFMAIEFSYMKMKLA